MKDYEIVLKNIEEETSRVKEQIEIKAAKRDNESDRFMRTTYEEDVNRLIGVYEGLYKAWCIVYGLMRKEENKK